MKLCSHRYIMTSKSSMPFLGSLIIHFLLSFASSVPILAGPETDSDVLLYPVSKPQDYCLVDAGRPNNADRHWHEAKERDVERRQTEIGSNAWKLKSLYFEEYAQKSGNCGRVQVIDCAILKTKIKDPVAITWKPEGTINRNTALHATTHLPIRPKGWKGEPLAT
jgi:hypothetical protein